MNAVIVYDAWFDNTRAIADAVGRGLASNVLIIDAHHALHIRLQQLDILIVGSPTHDSMPSPAIQTFLNKIGDDALKGIYVAAFDTRMRKLWQRFIGYANRRILISLRKRGGCVMTSPAGFYITKTHGPPRHGELARAERWGSGLADLWKANHTATAGFDILDTRVAPEVEVEL
jgi:flavodoxin